MWEKPPELAAASEVPQFVPQLQEFIGDHIRRREIQVHSKTEKNTFSHAVLGLALVLVSFGMYRNVEEITKLGTAAALMMDGRTDMLSRPSKKLDATKAKEVQRESLPICGCCKHFDIVAQYRTTVCTVM